MKKLIAAAFSLLIITSSALSAGAAVRDTAAYNCGQTDCSIAVSHNHSRIEAMRTGIRNLSSGICSFRYSPAESSIQNTAYNQYSPETTTAETPDPVIPQEFYCGTDGCGRTDEHYHSLCGLGDCSVVTNHEHDGILYYGHHDGDGHGYHGGSGYHSNGGSEYQGGGEYCYNGSENQSGGGYQNNGGEYCNNGGQGGGHHGGGHRGGGRHGQ